jgi:hypothetical protein
MASPPHSQIIKKILCNLLPASKEVNTKAWAYFQMCIRIFVARQKNAKDFFLNLITSIFLKFVVPAGLLKGLIL